MEAGEADEGESSPRRASVTRRSRRASRNSVNSSGCGTSDVDGAAAAGTDSVGGQAGGDGGVWMDVAGFDHLPPSFDALRSGACVAAAGKARLGLSVRHWRAHVPAQPVDLPALLATQAAGHSNAAAGGDGDSTGGGEHGGQEAKSREHGTCDSTTGGDSGGDDASSCNDSRVRCSPDSDHGMNPPTPSLHTSVSARPPASPSTVSLASQTSGGNAGSVITAPPPPPPLPSSSPPPPPAASGGSGSGSGVAAGVASRPRRRSRSGSLTGRHGLGKLFRMWTRRNSVSDDEDGATPADKPGGSPAATTGGGATDPAAAKAPATHTTPPAASRRRGSSGGAGVAAADTAPWQAAIAAAHPPPQDRPRRSALRDVTLLRRAAVRYGAFFADPQARHAVLQPSALSVEVARASRGASRSWAARQPALVDAGVRAGKARDALAASTARVAALRGGDRERFASVAAAGDGTGRAVGVRTQEQWSALKACLVAAVDGHRDELRVSVRAGAVCVCLTMLLRVWSVTPCHATCCARPSRRQMRWYAMARLTKPWMCSWCVVKSGEPSHCCSASGVGVLLSYSRPSLLPTVACLSPHAAVLDT